VCDDAGLSLLLLLRRGRGHLRRRLCCWCLSLSSGFLVLFLRFVVADGASGRSSECAMLAGYVADNASDCRPLEATFRFGHTAGNGQAEDCYGKD
jgi:hypothetical protein